MSSINEARRLVERYDCAFKNGRQKLFKEKKVHIGVLQIAISVLEVEIDDLASEIANWGEAIAYGYESGLTMPKWMIFHRLIMFVLRKHAERQYDRACKEIEYACEYNKQLNWYLSQFMVMNAW